MPRRSRRGRHDAERNGAEQGTLRATRRQLDADARSVFDDARPNLDEAFADGRELGLCKRVCLRNGVAHGEHQPVRGGVKHEAHLIGSSLDHAATTRAAYPPHKSALLQLSAFRRPALRMRLPARALRPMA